MTEKTVALLLARGLIRESLRLDDTLLYKAKLQINGRPLTDYVLAALQESDSEEIFIVQGLNEGLESVVTENKKNVFLTCDRESWSYASSLSFGLEKVIEYYGLDEVHRRNIMIVPCDIPVARRENFNFLMGEKEGKDTRVKSNSFINLDIVF